MQFKLILFALLLPALLGAQESFDNFLHSIETNNKKLVSAQKLAEAEALEAKTGIYLPNPELSYAHLSEESGYYSEMIIAQSFDFPSTYIHKNKIADFEAGKATAKYKQLKKEVFENAADKYALIVSVNRKLSILYEMNEKMSRLNNNAAKKFEVGEINIIEYNRIRNEAAKATAELRMLEAERNTLLLQITELNGGFVFQVTDTTIIGFLEPLLSDSVVSEIMRRHPFSNYWENELEIAERNISLEKAVSLPKFQLGYRQDANSSNANHGFIAGLSIPLFENKNSIKLAKAQQLYLQEEVKAEQLKLENSIEQMIQNYSIMQSSVQELDNVMKTLNTPRLLLKSYEAGQINYTEFFTEYENYKQTLFYIEELNQKVAALQLKIYTLMR